MNKNPPWAIKPLVPEEVYTDQQEYIDYFYQSALEAIGRRAMSTVLLGQRRMGKTEIFKRVVNRLFYVRWTTRGGQAQKTTGFSSYPRLVLV